ncbi:T9SS type A sorting domain-containing protein [Saccharicrinis sp. FJH54]|uniref:T9SS type A sorting domain-containing protein n=1 Tax=Saccharicrinis sp. FJH54 TaxID=3344665 RepID=UPI0035D51534
MKKQLLFLLLLPLTLNAQHLFEKELYSRSLVNLTDMVQLPDRGYMACGYAQPATSDTAYAIVLRMDSVMNTLWCKSYNMLKKDNFRTLTKLQDGNFIVGGTTRTDFSTYYGASMYKIDGDGNVLWHMLYDNSYDDATLGVFEQSDNSLVLIIRYGVSGKPTKIIHTKSDGSILNQIRIAKPEFNGGPVPDDVVSDGAGNFFICGNTRNTTTNAYGAYILSTGTTGYNWFKEYDFEGLDASATNIAMLGNGDLVISGNIADSVATNATHMVFMRVSAVNGDPVWTKEIQQEPVQIQQAFGITAILNNQILVSGRILNYEDIRSFTLKLDVNGNIIWAKEYGNGPFASLSMPMETGRNTYLLAGRKTATTGPYFIVTDTAGNSSCNTSPVEFKTRDLSTTSYESTLELDDPELTTMSPAYVSFEHSINVNTICSRTVSVRNPYQNTGIHIYPNPARDVITIDLHDQFEPDAVLRIYNLQGVNVFKDVLNAPNSTYRMHFKQGVYIWEITTSDKTLRQRVTIH